MGFVLQGFYFTGWETVSHEQHTSLQVWGGDGTHWSRARWQSFSRIQWPLSQDEAHREGGRRMLPLSHANGAFIVPGPLRFECAACAAVSICHEFATSSDSPSHFNAPKFPGAAKWTSGSDSAAVAASHPTPFLNKYMLFFFFYWLILPGLLPWLLTAFLPLSPPPQPFPLFHSWNKHSKNHKCLVIFCHITNGHIRSLIKNLPCNKGWDNIPWTCFASQVEQL